MIISIMDNLKQFVDNVNQYIGDHADEPFFWLILFAILLVIALLAISKLSNK